MLVDYSINYIIKNYYLSPKQQSFESFKHFKILSIESFAFFYDWFINLFIFRKAIKAFDDRIHDF